MGLGLRRTYASLSAAVTRLLRSDVFSGVLPSRFTLDPLRLSALAGAAALIVAFLSLLVDAVTVTADPAGVTRLAIGSMLVATVLARFLGARAALGVGIVAFAAGLAVYLTGANVAFRPRVLLGDTLDLLSGMSVLQLQELRLWALAVTPAPVFLTWYLAVRHRYGLSAFVGSMAVGFFVLTGDAGATTTLFGVVAATATVCLGDLSESGSAVRSLEVLAPIVAVMVVAPLFVSVIPAGGVAGPAAPAGPGSGPGSGSQADSAPDIVGAGDRTMSGAVVDADDELEVIGSVSLWPEVQFVVRADRGQYWRTSSYDRYTGDGWVSTVDLEDSEFRPVEGPTVRVDQTVRAETEMYAMPAAYRPFAVESDSIAPAEITVGPSLSPNRPLTRNETYTVSSSVPDSTPEELRAAGTEYPEEIEAAYTQLPSDVPDRVQGATEELTADADDPYETAVTIEQFLRTNKEYSLTVDRPDGDVADAFLFEMDAGYCTYFATTMVAMLRSQDVPARIAAGYSTGQRVDDDTWVVRGSNAHTWVEVYFPEHGWIAFEPTPPGELEGTQAESLENMREVTEEFDEQNVFDTNESWGVPAGGLPPAELNETADDGGDREEGDEELEEQLGTVTEDFGAGSNEELEEVLDPETESDDDVPAPVSVSVSVPGGEQLALIALLALGAVAVARRSSRVRRTVASVRVRYQRRRDPKTDIERAFERTMTTLELRYRPRKRGETVREYLNAVDPDPRVRRVARIRERARYRGDRSAEAAEEAVELVGELITDRPE